MKKNHIGLAILGLIVLVAVFTNPDQNRHKEVIKNKFITYLQKSIKKEQANPKDDFEQAAQAIGITLSGMIAEKVLDNLVTTDNYVVFSTTKITWEGETRVIGIGAFGNVFITKKLDDSLSKGLLEN